MRIFIVLSCALLAACTSSGPPDQKVAPRVKDAPPFIRDCDSAVFGDVNVKNAVMIGPLMLVGARQAANLPERAFRPRAGRYGAVKMLAVVKGSSDVTVSVPDGDRDSVRLLYNPDARANRYGFLLSAGHTRVTFKGCRDIEPQYNGGFIAAEPTCLSLDVQSEGISTSGWISLGAGRSCP